MPINPTVLTAIWTGVVGDVEDFVGVVAHDHVGLHAGLPQHDGTGVGILVDVLLSHDCHVAVEDDAPDCALEGLHWQRGQRGTWTQDRHQAAPPPDKHQ